MNTPPVSLHLPVLSQLPDDDLGFPIVLKADYIYLNFFFHHFEKLLFLKTN